MELWTAEPAEPTEPKEMTVFIDNYLWQIIFSQ